eukprot:3551781-Amphidinium_carterae.1
MASCSNEVVCIALRQRFVLELVENAADPGKIQDRRGSPSQRKLQKKSTFSSWFLWYTFLVLLATFPSGAGCVAIYLHIGVIQPPMENLSKPTANVTS